MALTKDEIEKIAEATANIVISRLENVQGDVELRNIIIGCIIGEGAIPVHGRENRKAPCTGCRIDLDKPFDADNFLGTTEGAIGSLNKEEAREWCSELVEVKDGRCKRVQGIHEAAIKCKEKYPNDSNRYFSCFVPSWGALPKE